LESFFGSKKGNLWVNVKDSFYIAPSPKIFEIDAIFVFSRTGIAAQFPSFCNVITEDHGTTILKYVLMSVYFEML